MTLGHGIRVAPKFRIMFGHTGTMNEKVIRFTPSEKSYYAQSIESDFLKSRETYISAALIEVPIGQSLIGGPFVDLPEGLTYPDGHVFVAQLKLADVSKVDPNDLLPKSGYLYVFCSEHMDSGKVFYADVHETQLTRVVKDHDQNFFLGNVVKDVFADVDDLEKRYSGEGASREWDYFAGSRTSKIFGYFTHCQYGESEILAKTADDVLVLLQVGEDFTEEGVLSVTIKKESLVKRDFSDCHFAWGQS